MACQLDCKELVPPLPLAPTPPGLEDQLLGKLILKEKHELEEQRQALLEEVQSYKKKIKQLEDDLLFRWGFLVYVTRPGGARHNRAQEALLLGLRPPFPALKRQKAAEEGINCVSIEYNGSGSCLY